MQNPGETPIEHGDWISQARHRVAALAGRAVRFVFGESAPAPELYDPEYDYSTRQEALRTLWLASLPEEVAATRNAWHLGELANPVGPEAILAAFAPENEVLWAHNGGRVIQNCVVDWASRMFASVVSEGRNYSDKEGQVWFTLLARLGLDQAGRSEVSRAWDTLQYDSLVKGFEDANIESDKTPQELATDFVTRIIHNNLITMFELERRRPGAVRALYNDFGIRNFGRYESDDLLLQLTLEHREADLHLSVVVSDTDDSNGAFEADAHRGAAKKLLAGSQIIYSEARRGGEALRRTVAIARRLGSIDQLMIASHALEDSIGNGTSGVLAIEDITGARGLARLKDGGVLSEEAVALLYGCLAGAPDGIATALAHTAGVPTFAFDAEFLGFDDFSTFGEPEHPMRTLRRSDGTGARLVLIRPDGSRHTYTMGSLQPLANYSLSPSRQWTDGTAS